jgi:hypothetical protein
MVVILKNNIMHQRGWDKLFAPLRLLESAWAILSNVFNE